MALTEKLMILITGDASGAIGEMKKLAGETEKNLGKAGGDVSKFSQNATKIGAGMVAVGTGLLATAISAASTTTDLGREVMKLQRYTGMNAESASKLAYSAKMSGVAVDDLAVGIGKLSKTMANTPDKLTKFGVEAKTADGKLRTMSDVLGDVADRFKKMGPGTEATAGALDLFGRSGANLLPFLFKGRNGIAELSDEAEKMGLVLSQDNVDAVKANIVAQRHLSAAVNGAKVQIGNEMLPILTKFTELITGIPGPVRDVIVPVVVLGGVVLVAGGAFLLMAGQVQKAKTAYIEMGATAQMTTKLLGIASLVVSAGVAVWGIYEQGVTEARTAADKINDAKFGTAAAQGIGALSGSISQLSSEASALKEKGDGWSHFSWFWERDDADGARQSAEATAKAMQMLIDQALALADATGMSGDEALAWLNELRNTGTEFPTAAAAVAAYTGKIDENKLSTEEAKTAQEGFEKSIKSASDALRASVDPYFAVTKGRRDLDEATKALREAEQGHAANSPEVQSALEAQVDAGLALVDALGKVGVAHQNAGTDAKAFEGALDSLRILGINPSSEAGRVMIERITGIQTTADEVTKWLQAHPFGVRVADEELKAAIENMHYMRFLMSLQGQSGEGSGYNNWHKDGAGNWVRNSTVADASGGFVPQGRPTLVGELGPELFIPSSSGTVMTSLSTSHALSGGGGAGVTIQNLTVALPNVTNGDELVDELQRYIRRNGPLPLAVA